MRAFNLEVATVIDAVRGNVVPGQMRLRWWKEVVHDLFPGNGQAQAKVPKGYPVRLHEDNNDQSKLPGTMNENYNDPI